MAIVAEERIVPVKIKATDETRAAVEQAKTNLKGLDKQSGTTSSAMQRHWEGMRSSFLKVSIAIAGAMLAIRKAWEYANMTAQFLEQQAALNALGRQYQMTGAQIVAATQKASTGLMSMKEAADVAAKSLSRGFNPRQLTEMTAVATKLSDVFQYDIAEGVSNLSTAIQTGVVKTLKTNFGIVVDLDAAYKRFATSQRINVSTLDEQTKMQIRYNLIMEAAAGKVGRLQGATDSIDDKMTRIRKNMEDFTLFLGSLAIRFFAFLQMVFAAVNTFVWGAMAIFMKPFAWLENLLEKVGITFTDRFFNTWQFKYEANAMMMIEKVKEGWSVLTASMAEMAGEATAATNDMVEETDESQELIYQKFVAELQRRHDAMVVAFQRERDIGRQRVAADQAVQDNLLAVMGNEFDQRREALRQEYLALAQHASDKLALEVWYQEELKRIRQEQQKQEKEDAEEKKRIAFEEWDAKRAIISGALGSFASMFQALAGIQGKHAKAAFIAFKAFAIAEAIIDAHRGYARAIATLPPPFSYIAAAAAFAAGIARVIAISQVQPSGGGGASAPAPAAPAQVATQVATAPTEPAGSSGPTINIHIAGNLVNMDELGRELIPSIQKALADGVG
jgi:hypothetical protein